MSYDLDELERQRREIETTTTGQYYRELMDDYGDAIWDSLPAMIRDLREAKEKLHLFEYAVDAAKNGGAFTADEWTMISSKLHLDLLVAKEQVEGAEELLREVEWSSDLPDEEALELYRTVESVPSCPVCGNNKSDDHAPDCRLKKWLERRP